MQTLECEAIHSFQDYHSSETWIKTRSLAYLKLTFQDLISLLRQTSEAFSVNKKRKDLRHHLKSQQFNDFEKQLHSVVMLYKQRIQWLKEGSQKIFGLIQGDSIVVLIDVSDSMCSFGRLIDLKKHLQQCISEQLSTKKSLCFIAFGSNTFQAWDGLKDTSNIILRNVESWISDLSSKGSCNLLLALKQVFKLKNINCICLILGSCLDQSPDLLLDYIEQCNVGRNIPVHTVAYKCDVLNTKVFLQKLSEMTAGYYFCFPENFEIVDPNQAILNNEIQKAEKVIEAIMELKKDLIGKELDDIVVQISDINHIAKATDSAHLSEHENKLEIKYSEIRPRTSKVWLLDHGLKANKLNIYQVLAPNAFSSLGKFIPIINKCVTSHILERAMVSFPWFDGSIKNVHVDIAMLYDYQRQLSACVRVFEKRLDWLSQDSRKIFGTLVEKRIILLIDMSAANMDSLINIQNALRHLIEQQLANRDSVNIVRFGGTIQFWKNSAIEPTEHNLEEMWRWILKLKCEGNQNFIAALQKIADSEIEDNYGIYLFSIEIPNEPLCAVYSYVREICTISRITLHVVYINLNESDLASGSYSKAAEKAEFLREIADAGGGRFHWVRKKGIVESTDIQLILNEVNEALDFSNKCVKLIDAVKMKYKQDHGTKKKEESEEIINVFQKVTLNKSNHLSSSLNKKRFSVKQLHLQSKPWKPIKAWSPVGKSHLEFSIPEIIKPKTMKEFPTYLFPDIEEFMTSNEWLQKYNLSKLKLDFQDFASMKQCKHAKKIQTFLGKTAHYCSIYPSVNIRGFVKHIPLQQHEFKHIEKRLRKTFNRYLKRLHWLLTGSRQTFGVITHKRVIFIIDTSCNMKCHLNDLRKYLTLLIKEQLYRLKVSFNIITFGCHFNSWRNKLVGATKENCGDAVSWCDTFVAEGNSGATPAIQFAFLDPDVESIYLLMSNDNLNECLPYLNQVKLTRPIVLNTISFKCSERSSSDKLRQLAHQYQGRYHYHINDADTLLLIRYLINVDFSEAHYLEIPTPEGDDLELLYSETTKAAQYLKMIKYFKLQYKDLREISQERNNTVY